MAGVCLGTNNFFLGFISELGINAATLFSVGAFIFTSTYKFVEAIKMKKKHGKYFPLEFSNFMYQNLNKGTSINWSCVAGLTIRTVFNISF